jgi:uncharacterized protein (TIGR02996 family)
MADPLHALEVALVKDPDDRAAHAAYADLLQEREEPRGEFIQVQHALEDSTLPATQCRKLQAREKALLKHHAAEWLGALHAHTKANKQDYPHLRYRFARGWLDEVIINLLEAQLAHDLVESAQTLLLEDAEDVGRADCMALLVQTLADVGQGQTLLTETDDLGGQLFPFAGQATSGAVDDEELTEVGLVGEVADNGTDGVGVQVEAFRQLLGWNVLRIVGFYEFPTAFVHGQSPRIFTDQDNKTEGLRKKRGLAAPSTYLLCCLLREHPWILSVYEVRGECCTESQPNSSLSGSPVVMGRGTPFFSRRVSSDTPRAW